MSTPSGCTTATTTTATSTTSCASTTPSPTSTPSGVRVVGVVENTPSVEVAGVASVVV